MGRFRKGTLDHDGDGRMGGSLKGSKMTEKKKSAPKTKGDDKPDEAGSNDPASRALVRHPESKEG